MNTYIRFVRRERNEIDAFHSNRMKTAKPNKNTAKNELVHRAQSRCCPAPVQLNEHKWGAGWQRTTVCPSPAALTSIQMQSWAHTCFIDTHCVQVHTQCTIITITVIVISNSNSKSVLRSARQTMNSFGRTRPNYALLQSTLCTDVCIIRYHQQKSSHFRKVEMNCL